jgi:hypothetical protein
LIYDKPTLTFVSVLPTETKNKSSTLTTKIMKRKIDLILKKLYNDKIVILIVTIFVLLACSQEQPSTLKKPDHDILNSNLLAVSLDKYKNGGESMNEVATFLRGEYDINYDEEYDRLLPHFNLKNNLNKSARGMDIAMSDLSPILENAGISESSQAYDYLVKVSNLFEDEQLAEEQIRSRLNEFRNQIENNALINSAEKERLLATSTLLLHNFSGIADNLYESEGGIAGGRTNGWLRRAWRVVRSVVLTAAVGALVGASMGPKGAIVGAIVMGAVAITDVAANNHCHFAMQCDGGWRQNCTTGVCTPFI